MNEPKRWSSQGSDVDPVLRSVLRYARDLAPNSAELRALVQGTAARRRSTSAPPSRRRSRTWAGLGLAATFAAGAALASYGNQLWFAPAAPVAPPSVAPVKAVPPLGLAGTSVAPLPRPEASAVDPATANSAAPTRTSPAAVAAVLPAPDQAQDAAMLQEARGLVASNPARALMLTRDHELHFPNSALNEERQALRIEALARLGRSAEAARELTTFERRFPRSIYARRLHALPVP